MKKFEFPIWRNRYAWRADADDSLYACVSSFNGYFRIPNEVREAYVVISTRPSEHAYEIKVEGNEMWWGPSHFVTRRCKNNRWRGIALSPSACRALFRVLHAKGYEEGKSIYVSVEYDS